MIDIGDPLPFNIEVRDAAGVLSDTADGSLTIYLPDGTNEVATVGNAGLVRLSVGLYAPSYITTLPGRHDWVYASVSPPTRQTGVFNVSPARPEGLLSLTEARKHLNKTSTEDDEQIREMVEAVTSLIEDGDGADWPGMGPIVPRTVVERVSPSGPLMLLTTYPVLSLSTVDAAVTGGGTYAVGDMTVEGATGMVRFSSGASFFGYPVTVTYVAGRTVVPPAVILAAKIVLKHMWETQRGTTPAALVQGEEPVFQGQVSAMPPRALELLGGRRRAPFVA